MKIRKSESHREIPKVRDPKEWVSPEMNPRKKRKSDLTIGFVDSSD
jgi:hypothetical protein